MRRAHRLLVLGDGMGWDGMGWERWDGMSDQLLVQVAPRQPLHHEECGGRALKIVGQPHDMRVADGFENGDLVGDLLTSESLTQAHALHRHVLPRLQAARLPHGAKGTVSQWLSERVALRAAHEADGLEEERRRMSRI
jgi:hypothetical protein